MPPGSFAAPEKHSVRLRLRPSVSALPARPLPLHGPQRACPGFLVLLHGSSSLPPVSVSRVNHTPQDPCQLTSGQP